MHGCGEMCKGQWECGDNVSVSGSVGTVEVWGQWECGGSGSVGTM